MNLGRFAGWLHMMMNRITGVTPQAASLTPAPPPSGNLLVTDDGTEFVTDDGTNISYV